MKINTAALHGSKGPGSTRVLVFPTIGPLPTRSILSLPGPGSAEGDKQQCSLFSWDTFCSCANPQSKSQGVLGGSLVTIQDKSPTNT